MSEKTVVMPDSPEAAQYQTDIKGWVSRTGHYYGNGLHAERTARYAGCTHVPCNRCGMPTLKGYMQCGRCQELFYIETYDAMPQSPWGGKAVLYSQARDQYYSTPDAAAEDLEEGQTLADLYLVICEPNYVRLLESDYCCDELAEDHYVPDEVWAAMMEFNVAVAGIVLSWSPGKMALALRRITL